MTIRSTVAYELRLRELVERQDGIVQGWKELDAVEAWRAEHDLRLIAIEMREIRIKMQEVLDDKLPRT